MNKVFRKTETMGESNCVSSLCWTHYEVCGHNLRSFFMEGVVTLKPGMIVGFRNGEQIIIGHATPYIQPTTNDVGIGWDWNDPICQKEIAFLIVVHDIVGTTVGGKIIHRK